MDRETVKGMRPSWIKIVTMFLFLIYLLALVSLIYTATAADEIQLKNAARNMFVYLVLLGLYWMYVYLKKGRPRE